MAHCVNTHMQTCGHTHTHTPQCPSNPRGNVIYTTKYNNASSQQTILYDITCLCAIFSCWRRPRLDDERHYQKLLAISFSPWKKWSTFKHTAICQSLSLVLHHHVAYLVVVDEVEVLECRYDILLLNAGDLTDFTTNKTKTQHSVQSGQYNNHIVSMFHY